MKKPTKTTDKDQIPEEDASKMTTKGKIRRTKKLTETVDEHWEYEENEPDMGTHRKRKNRSANDAKKIMDASWSTVPHTPLFSRKVTAESKIKIKCIQIRKTTTVKKFSKQNPNPPVAMTPLAQRKAKHLLDQTVSQVIKTTLKDYNSIHFKAQAS
jgi:hypothetical protein